MGVTDLSQIRDITGYEGLYKVSDGGEIFSNYHGNMLNMKPIIDKYGYCVINLYKHGRHRQFFIHRIVAKEFLPIPSLGETIINHKDEIKTNNSVENLEWCTTKYNVNYRDLPIRRAAKRRKPVIALKDGKQIRFNSIAEASEKTGANRTCISLCLSGKQNTCGGFRWQYG